MKLGGHAVLFKERIKDDTDALLQEFASIGYKGVEIGSRFFGTDERESLQEKLDKYGIEISAMHVGVPLVDWLTKPEELEATVLAVADFMSGMKNKNVCMTGQKLNLDYSADFKKIAQRINEVSKKCKDLGVTLNYHNHDWEFENDAIIYKALAEYAVDTNFAFDLGWVYVGGFDPVKMVKDHADRISYLHLRDTIAVGTRDFAEIGHGTLDLPVLMNVVKGVLGDNGWGVVEFDKGEVDMNRYKNAKAYFDTIL